MTEAARLIALSKMLSAVEHAARLLRRNCTLLNLIEHGRRELADQLDRERGERSSLLRQRRRATDAARLLWASYT
jgi:hypothetical protein